MIKPINWLDTWGLSIQLYKQRKLIDGFLDLTNELDKEEWKTVKTALSKCLMMMEPNGPRPEVIRIGICKLSPKEASPWKQDTPGELGSLVFHLSIVTNPFCVMYAGQQSLHMPVGMFAFISTEVPHSAINMGETPAFHLCIEVKRPQVVKETIQ